MEDQILFIYNYFTCRIAYYLKAIYSCEFRYEVLDSHWCRLCDQEQFFHDSI